MLKTTTAPATLRATMGAAYLHSQALTPDISAQYSRIYWTPGARQALVELSRSYDADRAALLQSLDAVQAPALIVWTDRDPWFPVSVAERLHDLLPRADLRVIPDAGHLPQEEQPTAFLDVVLAWLN
jgi:pimeloyl-ACP methyl ester carboxylesterase